MRIRAITPILNVADMDASFAWFEKWGWRKCWDWGTPAKFGAVGIGDFELYLCSNAQGGRGRGLTANTMAPEGDETQDKGVWMTVWVDDVDSIYDRCVAAQLEITLPPSDMPWYVREMHVRHPDGHIFRITKGVGD
jgi:predicted enzyme related to lactoylglutathione lyase